MRTTLVTLALLATSATASAQTHPHLCAPGEEAVFACSTGAKIVSLCASKDIGENAGYLQYRFGTRRKTELVYPADTSVRPQSVFSNGVTGGTGGGADFLRFTSQDTTYTLFSDYYRGRERDGLVVERGGKRISVMICRGSAVDTRMGWGTVYRAKLPQSPPDFEVP